MRPMLKRLMLAVLLALQFVAVTNVATAEVPFPQCLPCPEDDPPPVR
jgi:hypothetical protein